jgi:branched-subunit amino acid ABC-type transport system permease component
LWWISNIVHLAHGGVMLVAGFALYVALGALGLPFILAFPLACALALASGVALDRFLYKPLIARGTDEMGLLTASLGVLIAIQYALTLVFGPEGVTMDADRLRGPLGLRLLPVVDLFAVLVVATTILIFIGLDLLVARTMIGRKMRAVAENPELARILGADTFTVQTIVGGIAAALVAPAAAFLLFSTGITPAEAFDIVLIAGVVALVGGRGSILGALVGGLLIGVAESVTTWQFAAGWRQLITFVFLYVLMLVRPQGLFGRA